MKLSHRITNIVAGGSDGWDVFYKARHMVAAGEPVLELTIGEHDIGTSGNILGAMHTSATGGHTGYAMVPGTHALRKTVAERIASRTGVPTTANNILITPVGKRPFMPPITPSVIPVTRRSILTHIMPPTLARSVVQVRSPKRSSQHPTPHFNPLLPRCKPQHRVRHRCW